MALPQDDDIQDMTSSSMSDPDVAAPAEQQNAATANSSSATGETDDDLLSVARDVVESVRAAEVEQEAPPAEDEVGSSETADKEDFSNVPFAQHPRFKQVISQRLEFKKRAEAAEADAQRYNNVQAFLDQNGLAAEEAADLLTIGGLMKTNPVEAWRRAKPVVQKLLIAAGEVLPGDLVERVTRGELSQDAALEVSRTRAMQTSMQATRTFEQRRQEMQAQQDAAFAVRSAVEEWQADREKKDPNFAAKLPLLTKEIAYLQRAEGIPDTPQGAREQLTRAYKALQPVAQTRSAAPVKKAITPVNGGQVAGNQRPVGRTTMDIVRAHRTP